MSTKLSIWVIGAVSALGLAAPAAAGGPMVRPGAVQAGFIRPIRTVPPVAGTWHVRTGHAYLTGWGRANTAFRPGGVYSWHAFPGTGVSVYGPGYGHTSTAWTGASRVWGNPVQFARNGWPYGAWRNRTGLRYGLGYGRRYAYRQWRNAPRYTAGGYGGYGYGSSGYGGGYVEPSVSSQYGEGPLNQGYDAGRYDTQDGPEYGAAPYTPSIVGMGGPRVFTVDRAGDRPQVGCACARDTGPIVYRFGVGSYY